MPPPPDTNTFFFDRCLSRLSIKYALTGRSANLIFLDEIFPKVLEDEEWIKHVGENGWIGFTKDKGIRQRQMVYYYTYSHRARLFIITSGDMKGTEQGTLFAKSIKKINNFIARHEAPFMASINAQGSIHELDIEDKLKDYFIK